MTQKLNTPLRRARFNPAKPAAPYYMEIDELPKGVRLGYRKSSDSWVARVFHDDRFHTKTLGKCGTMDYAEAVAAAAVWAAKKRQGQPDQPKPKYTLRQVLEAYYSSLNPQGREHEAESERQAKMRITALDLADHMDQPVDHLTAADIKAVQRRYAKRKHNGEPISLHTVDRTMVYLIAALNEGFDSDMVESRDAWSKVKRMAKPEVDDEKDEGMSRPLVDIKDRLAFIEACPRALKSIVTALHYTSARPSELRRLKVSDVQLGNDRMFLQTMKGKRRKAFPLPVGSEIRAVVEDAVKGKAKGEYVFLTLQRKPWSQANLSKQHKAVVTRQDMPEGFDTYAWRHNRITDWARQFPAPEVAELSRTSLEFIQKNYYKKDTELQAAMAIL